MEPCLGAGGSYGRRDDVTQYADPNLPAPAGMIVFNDDVTEVSEELARVEAGEEVEDESTFSYAVDNLSQWRTQYKDWSDDSALGGAGGWYSGEANWPPPNTCLVNQLWAGTDAPDCFFRTYSDEKYSINKDSDGVMLYNADGSPQAHPRSGAYIYPATHGQFVNPILRQMGYVFPQQIRTHSSLNLGQYWHSNGTGFLDGVPLSGKFNTHTLVSSLDSIYLPILSEIGFFAQFSWDDRWVNRFGSVNASYGVHNYPWHGGYWGTHGAGPYNNPPHPFVSDETIHPLGVAAVRGRYGQSNPWVNYWYYGINPDGSEGAFVSTPYDISDLWEKGGTDLWGGGYHGLEQFLLSHTRVNNEELFCRGDACPALGENRDFRIRQFLYWQGDLGTACLFVSGSYEDNACLELKIPQNSLKKFYCGDAGRAADTANPMDGMMEPDEEYYGGDPYYNPNANSDRYPEPSTAYGECQTLWNNMAGPPPPELDGSLYMDDPTNPDSHRWTPAYLNQHVVADGMEFTIGSASSSSTGGSYRQSITSH